MISNFDKSKILKIIKQDNFHIINNIYNFNRLDFNILAEINQLNINISNSNKNLIFEDILNKINNVSNSDKSILFVARDNNNFTLFSESISNNFNYKIPENINFENNYINIFNSLKKNEIFSINKNKNYHYFNILEAFVNKFNNMTIFPIVAVNKLIAFIAICNSKIITYLNKFELLLLSNTINNIGFNAYHLIIDDVITELNNKVNTNYSIQSEFLSNISHEIRTPMNAIIGFSELLRKTNTLNSIQMDYVDSISQSSYNLLELFNDFLDLSKINSNKIQINPTFTDIRNLLKAINQYFDNISASKGIKFIISIDDNTPVNLLLDEMRIRQILFNLVGNAIKFTETGFVELSVESFNVNSNIYNIDIHVKDTGIGIQATNIQDIFNAFKQIDSGKRKKYPGTGLGLTIAKKLSNLMGADIQVESYKGAGSTFTLKLKNIQSENTNLTLNQITNENTFKNNVNDIQFKSQLVIISEADLTVRQFLKLCLRNQNLNILNADTGKQVIKLLSEHKPDLLLINLNIPDNDAIETIKNINILYPEYNFPKIAIIDNNISYDNSLIKAFFDGMIIKPIIKNDLLTVLSNHLELQDIRTSNKQISTSQESRNYETLTENIPKEFYDILESELIPLYNSIRKTMYISNINHFIDYLQNISNKYNLQIFKNISNDLNKRIKEYKIDKVYQIIHNFSEIIEQIKNK